jgi:glycosyltransferase involved in cell wall biosynthesis
MSELHFAHPNRPLIGLNGRFLVAQRTGVQRSAYLFFRHLIAQGHAFNFVLFTGESEIYAPEWQQDNVRIVASNLTSKSILKNHFWEQIILPKLAKKYKVDVLHNPANLAPLLFLNKSIVNIHDVCFLIEPTWFAPSFRFIYTFLVPQIARSARLVVTNSNHSKNDILELLTDDISRIRLTYWAVEPLFFQEAKPWNSRSKQILFVGSLEPRKNLTGLLEAFNRFKRRNPDCDYKLILVGCENSLFAEQRYELGEFAKEIEFAGYISDAELAALYADSRMLVYPSFYEGFGFPPLEAMAAGTPVITSFNSSLPEVVGEAAILVNPSDCDEIANKMEQIFRNPDLAQSLIERGHVQARKFSWEKTASHMLEIYDEVLSGDRSKNKG